MSVLRAALFAGAAFWAAAWPFAARAVPAPSVSSGREARPGDVPGLRPDTTDFSHLRAACVRSAAERPRRALGAGTALPSRWSAVDRGWVTPVRSQGSYGTCWAFSTAAALETAYLREAAVTNDFSENHIARHDVGFSLGFGDGGNNQLAAALLTAWRDPVPDAADPYPKPSSTAEPPPVCHVQDIVWLPARTAVTNAADTALLEDENRILKEALLEYGALSVDYYHNDGSYVPARGAHYYRAGHPLVGVHGGHAVTMVGWDDAYPVSFFKAGREPPGPGAFLVKNSWGVGGNTTNGYTWISYYDEELCRQISAAYPLPEDPRNYARAYAYDPCGQVSTWNVYEDSADEARGGKENWCANVFTSVATGVVEAVGFYAMTAGTVYELRVYVDCATPDPSSGALAARETGVIASAGYATVRLAEPVALREAGRRFAVALHLTTPGYDYPLPVECTLADSSGLWCTATANAGESFMSPDGETWRDFQYYDPTGNFCIKAYTRAGAEGEARELVASGYPEGPVTLRAGETAVFGVVPTADAVGSGFEWSLDGDALDCGSTQLVFRAAFADHGNHELSCRVSSGSCATVVRWSLTVTADLQVAADSAAAEPDGSAERPFPTIGAAVHAAVEGDRIVVAEGVYRETVEPIGPTVSIVSSAGPARTFIDAGGTAHCYSGRFSDTSSLAGFTLENATNSGYYGGAVYYGVVSNCVIRGCLAGGGAGAYMSKLYNCRLEGNVAEYYGGGADACGLYGCLLVGNRASVDGGGACDCELGNCTVTGNSAGRYGGGVAVGDDAVINCIVTGNGSDRGWRFGPDIDGSAGLVFCTLSGGDAGFADAAGGDWRLSARSAALDAGLNAAVLTAADLAGSVRVFGAAVDLGAYEYAPGPSPLWPTPAVAPDDSPAREAEAVAAVTSIGVRTLPEYLVLRAWAEPKGLAPADCERTPGALVSAALDADGALPLGPDDVAVTAFRAVTGGVWRLEVDLPAYDLSRAYAPILRRAVGAAGADDPAGEFAPLQGETLVGPDGVAVETAVPDGATRRFLRATVR